MTKHEGWGWGADTRGPHTFVHWQRVMCHGYMIEGQKARENYHHIYMHIYFIHELSHDDKTLNGSSSSIVFIDLIIDKLRAGIRMRNED